MQKELRRFFNEFVEEGNTTGVPFYHAYMEHLVAIEEYAFNLDCSQLRTFNVGLYENLINYPREMISICDFVLHVCDPHRASFVALALAIDYQAIGLLAIVCP